ncbi:Catalase isozyme 3 [Dichanthelium oligosanthes]|uniref:Catalase n=1 Tax=Dichanthelium oligosanthes TaxID=888268 RepID=A0A1E5WC71_9POAL|nr:Catalase isozyme 3 [Dichanthelium oligosanthes]
MHAWTWPWPQFRPSSSHDTTVTTTNAGAPVWNDNEALTVGPRGPILLEDYHLIEKVAHFARERIPERVVHARGASAKGFFECTHDVSALTCADFLRSPGTRTPVIVRFSTVIHERGSPETIRDPRGFAVKFYTREGNWDLLGNNFPVFFIRDGIKFPDVIHAFKPNPKSHVQEYWRVFDFLSHHPESLHTFFFLFDDVGVPTDYRHMEGFGVNTYTFINAAGKAHYVKFHWKPTCGVRCILTDEEAALVGGRNHSHATQDLYDSIAAGNFPEWKLFVQVMDPDTEDRYDFDPLDDTKTWPEDLLPLHPVGRLVLDRNIDNFFNENEQLAFGPGLVVPGIYYSDDKMLQCRVFAYADTQRYRLGPNYLMLPVNAPRCAHHNNHYDGAMNFMHRDEEVDYYPSRHAPLRQAPPTPLPPRTVVGKREKATIRKPNDFQQPGERYRSWDADRQERFVRRFADSLGHPKVSQELRSIWIDLLSKVNLHDSSTRSDMNESGPYTSLVLGNFDSDNTNHSILQAVGSVEDDWNWGVDIFSNLQLEEDYMQSTRIGAQGGRDRQNQQAATSTDDSDKPNSDRPTNISVVEESTEEEINQSQEFPEEEVEAFIRSEQLAVSEGTDADLNSKYTPQTGMQFKDRDDAHHFFNFYAFIVGFEASSETDMDPGPAATEENFNTAI